VDNERSTPSGFLGLGATAILSIVVLVGAISVRIGQGFQDKTTALTVVASAAAAGHSGIPQNNPRADYGNLLGNGSATAANDPYAPSQIGDNVVSTLANDYAILQQSGNYSTSSAVAAAQQLGTSLKATVTYKTYTAGDVKTSLDTSYSRMLTYRSDLQASLAPLLANTGPEIDMLTKYVQTNDPIYLTKLQQAADNYKLAAAKTALVVAPADAVVVQLGILNAMEEFAATLEQMVANAKDPLTEATLINSYMQAQQDMFASFNNLYGYYKSKQV
jgi:hypothetical protein